SVNLSSLNSLRCAGGLERRCQFGKAHPRAIAINLCKVALSRARVRVTCQWCWRSIISDAPRCRHESQTHTGGTRGTIHEPDNALPSRVVLPKNVRLTVAVEIALHGQRHDFEDAPVGVVGNVKLAIRIFA